MNRWQAWSLAGITVVGLLGVGVLVFWLPPNQLAKDFNDADPAVRAAAIRQAPPGGYQRQIVDRLEDENADVRIVAADKLGTFAPARGSEMPRALVRAFKDEHAGVRQAARWALRWIGSATWPALRDALEDGNPRVRALAVQVVIDPINSKYGDNWPVREHKSLAPILNGLLDDPDPEVRSLAQKALERLRKELPSDRATP